ncbi:MAG: aminofutalosine synthase MqnE [Candidatus Handelsmanbacteria bacterium RIFCSPLOWO2_12_FULL_64_10]|uniref:Aminofutalosine synthase MqnE n=1 Tax=Handelsmanbacteria sp. (strain RIFCSPLOWO2_12_FULL_64_10) TaxID=1817868 RepID=A0A1F6CW33_HANXR|nr:MAG: aminofutalosine synthase MqnE [Candidatus Handelsmanbacteria bacterium RIFCSPLOWO2_12_FULL_64_10]
MEALIRTSELADIYDKVLSGVRLSREDGLRLYETDDLPLVGYTANLVRERMNGSAAYYVRNQHINYTNVCNKLCKFCSFYVPPKDERGYVLSPEDIQARVRQHIDLPITEVHMVAGINPKLPYQYYLDILDAVRGVRPEAHIKAFTMIELAQIQRVAKKPMRDVLLDLRAHGLSSLPGGGAEVFSDRVHEDLFWTKADSEQWLSIARTAHGVGLRSNATMLYGHVENPEEKVDHLIRLRELQDETGGFLTYIPLSFHPERTELEHLPGPTGSDDLREIAVGRLMLDNFPHIKTFWIMNTIEVSQAALWYGADDIDGTIMEYEITRRSLEETRQVLTRSQLVARIVEAGRDPVERDNLYHVISTDREVVPETIGVMS